ILCTHCPVSGKRCPSGRNGHSTFLLVGTQFFPPSSDRNVPTDDIPMYIRRASRGSSKTVWRHGPPLPGPQFLRSGCLLTPSTPSQLAPRSSLRKRRCGSAPRYSTSGSSAGPGSICHRLSTGLAGGCEGSGGGERSFAMGVRGVPDSVQVFPQFFDSM